MQKRLAERFQAALGLLKNAYRRLSEDRGQKTEIRKHKPFLTIWVLHSEGWSLGALKHHTRVKILTVKAARENKRLPNR